MSLTRPLNACFACWGDGTHMHVFGTEPHDEIAAGYPIAVDRVSSDPSARMLAPSALARLRFRCADPVQKNVRPAFSDCMMVYSAADPLFHFDGFCSLVSQRAVDRLEPVIGREVEFVRVELDGAPSPYYVLWVRVIADALDHAASDAIEDPPDSGRFRIRRSSFRKQNAARFAFRLPAWRYAVNADLVTAAFVSEIVRHDLPGFRFRSGITGREVDARAIVAA